MSEAKKLVFLGNSTEFIIKVSSAINNFIDLGNAIYTNADLRLNNKPSGDIREINVAVTASFIKCLSDLASLAKLVDNPNIIGASAYLATLADNAIDLLEKEGLVQLSTLGLFHKSKNDQLIVCF